MRFGVHSGLYGRPVDQYIYGGPLPHPAERRRVPERPPRATPWARAEPETSGGATRGRAAHDEASVVPRGAPRETYGRRSCSTTQRSHGEPRNHPHRSVQGMPSARGAPHQPGRAPTSRTARAVKVRMVPQASTVEPAGTAEATGRAKESARMSPEAPEHDRMLCHSLTLVRTL